MNDTLFEFASWIQLGGAAILIAMSGGMGLAMVVAAFRRAWKGEDPL